VEGRFYGGFWCFVVFGDGKFVVKSWWIDGESWWIDGESWWIDGESWWVDGHFPASKNLHF
jgi:hypothetical protein